MHKLFLFMFLMAMTNIITINDYALGLAIRHLMYQLEISCKYINLPLFLVLFSTQLLRLQSKKAYNCGP